MLHKLHDKQDTLLREFISCFVKPEVIASAKNLVNIDVGDANNHLRAGLLFLGENTTKCLNKLSKDQRQSLLKSTVNAFVVCAQYLQKKMPVNNPALKICSCLDPIVRNTSEALQQLLQIPACTKLVGVADVDNFKREVRLYNTDRNLNHQPTDVPIDEWWAQVSTESYPNLAKAAKALLSCFHGPLVESSFSIMGDILDVHKGGMDIETYAAIQFVKTYLSADNKTAVEVFGKRDPIKQHVDPHLIKNMKGAARMNEERKQDRKQAEEKVRSDLGVDNLQKPTAKTTEKKQLLSKASLDKEEHSNAMEKESNKKRHRQEDENRQDDEESRQEQPPKKQKNLDGESRQEQPPKKQKKLSFFFS